MLNELPKSKLNTNGNSDLTKNSLIISYIGKQIIYPINLY